MLDAHYRSFQREILPQLNQRGIGPIGMKSLGGRGLYLVYGAVVLAVVAVAVVAQGRAPAEQSVPVAAEV